MVDKSEDVYHDYTTVMVGFKLDPTKIEWRLESSSTYAEYQSWESDMDRGFERCHTLDRTFGGHTEFVLAYRRVDDGVASWWHEERSAKGISGGTSSWKDFKQFLRARFLEKSTEMDKVVIPEDVVPLSGLNMQLKRVHDDTCMTADRGQRWNLFQAQCMIKGKACKLMIDGGSYCNGISKAVVETLGLSTWRIPEPKHVEWLNSCGMLKVTHKVRVSFTVGDYIDEVECDVLPLEVCGLLLGRPWQYDRNATHAGRANTYSFVHDGKQRTLKPIRDDQIKSDVVLVVRKEKLHKAKPKSGLAKLQQEEHGARSVDAKTDSAVHVDDRPVVLVGDKTVEDKPLIAERKDNAACVPVCVDTSVQTDDVSADHVTVHVIRRGDQSSFVSTPVRRSVGAAVRMHKGKDGRVRQLCRSEERRVGKEC